LFFDEIAETLVQAGRIRRSSWAIQRLPESRRGP
jgi:hypothetical protein